MNALPKCYDCGKFCTPRAWKMVYSGWPPTPDREIVRCQACFSKNGPFMPQDGIRPECSCGLLPTPKDEKEPEE